MSKLNYALLLSNLREATDELNRLCARLEAPDKPGESELEVGLAHAFHHLNFAWNGRRATDKRRRNLSDEDFNRWSRFPRDIPIAQVPLSRPRRTQRSRRKPSAR